MISSYRKWASWLAARYNYVRFLGTVKIRVLLSIVAFSVKTG